jgi:hypothetical protein
MAADHHDGVGPLAAFHVAERSLGQGTLGVASISPKSRVLQFQSVNRSSGSRGHPRTFTVGPPILERAWRRNRAIS